MAELVTPEAPILPWPRILRQNWLNLSFLHWAVEPLSIAHLYPPDTEPDTLQDLAARFGLAWCRFAAVRPPRLTPLCLGSSA